MGIKQWLSWVLPAGDTDDGQSARLGWDVQLRARFASVHGTRTCVFAPFFERTCDLPSR